jgi:hypothetical protein
MFNACTPDSAHSATTNLFAIPVMIASSCFSKTIKENARILNLNAGEHRR